jgi:peptidoglycan hydrolase CwlO-like protein
MRIRGIALAVGLAVAVAVATASLPITAGAAPVGQQLGQARHRAQSLRTQLAEVQAQLDSLLARYSALETQAGRASLRLVAANRDVQAAALEVSAAKEQLDRRVRTAYELGPSGIMQAVLTAGSFADVATANEFTAQALSGDAAALQATQSAQAILGVRRDAAAQARALLEPRQIQLQSLLSGMRTRVAQAQGLADQAGMVVSSLEQQQRAIAAATEREIGRNIVIDGSTGIDQSALLALLGPTGGRACSTPDGLVDTGKGFSGEATWYGWAVAGQGTASGAIFDPRLFTTANRWLPFGTFLRVAYGGKCAIVLVNDRGPYGDAQRVLDLSLAAASYLGISGVGEVRADILVPGAGATG